MTEGLGCAQGGGLTDGVFQQACFNESFAIRLKEFPAIPQEPLLTWLMPARIIVT